MKRRRIFRLLKNLRTWPKILLVFPLPLKSKITYRTYPTFHSLKMSNMYPKPRRLMILRSFPKFLNLTMSNMSKKSLSLTKFSTMT